MSVTPTSCSICSAPTERGMAYRSRAPGPRNPRSSRRWGEATTGRRGTGGAISQRGRVRDGRVPEPSGCHFTGELLDIERVTSSSERGGWKSACSGNSPAAYSTSRPVLRGRGCSDASPLPDYPYPIMGGDDGGPQRTASGAVCLCLLADTQQERRGASGPRARAPLSADGRRFQPTAAEVTLMFTANPAFPAGARSRSSLAHQEASSEPLAPGRR